MQERTGCFGEHLDSVCVDKAISGDASTGTPWLGPLLELSNPRIHGGIRELAGQALHE